MKRKIPAYLTLFFSLMMASLLGFILVLSQGVKQSTTRLESEIAMDTACNSALAEYHRELLEQYDLFAIDTSYGTSQWGIGNIAEHIRTYAQSNVSDTNFWDIDVNKIEIKEAVVTTDDECNALKYQIVQYMEKEWGVDVCKKILGSYEKTCEKQWDQGELLKMRDENQKKLDAEPAPKREKQRRVVDPETGEVSIKTEIEEVPIENPAEKINRDRNMGVLRLVIHDTQNISQMGVCPENYYSGRTNQIKGDGFEGVMEFYDETFYGTREDSFWEETMKRALITEYLFEKCGYYSNQKEEALLQYQIEYLIGKKDNDTDNLKIVVNEISAIREVANVIYLLSDTSKMAEITSIASSVAAVSLAPYLQPMIEISILFGWAYIESIQDVRTLLKGEKVPLIKTASDWHTSLTYALQGVVDDNGMDVREGRGLDYKGYLMVLLSTQKLDSIMKYFSDVVEMDIRETPYNENFRIDGCVTAFKACGDFISKDGYAYQTQRTYGY